MRRLPLCLLFGHLARAGTDTLPLGMWKTAVSRQFELQKASSTRSSAFPSKAQHQASMNRALEDRIKRGKANNELEQQLSRGQTQLESLQHDLKDEEAEAFETSELNSEVCVPDSSRRC